MTRAKAEDILRDRPDFSFLVRKSESCEKDYSLSIRYGCTSLSTETQVMLLVVGMLCYVNCSYFLQLWEGCVPCCCEGADIPCNQRCRAGNPSNP